MLIRNLIFSLIICSILLSPFLLKTNIIVKNDLNGNIIPLIYFKESLLNELTFPMWNPYINQGIPQTSDPLYGIFNPLISIPIILLPYGIAIKIIYLLSAILSVLSMSALLRYFKINEAINILLSITYSSCAYLAARIDSGHLEKVVSFGLLPLFFLSLIKTIKNKNLLWSGITAIIITLMLYSGDIYNALYSTMAIICACIYFFIKDKKITTYLLAAVILFLLFSSIKLIPIFELGQYLSKIKNPLEGSNNLVSILYYIFFPFESIDKFIPVNKFLSNYFGWWENISFIGPLSILGIYKIHANFKKILNNNLFTILIIVFLLMSMPATKINPYYYLISNISFLQLFHVPSRVFVLISILILISFGIILNKYYKSNKNIVYTILLINLLFTSTYFIKILNNNYFENIKSENINAVHYISKNNPLNYYSAHLTSQGDIPQDIAYFKNTFFIQSNYGLIIKNSPADNFTFNQANYRDITPGFIISNKDTNHIPNYRLVNQPKNKDINLFKHNNGTPIANISNEAYKVIFSANKITVNDFTPKNKKLTIIQNNYPGWTVYIDGKQSKLLDNKFLQVNTLEGFHKYEFRFLSFSFVIGAIISISSFTVWLIYIFFFKNNLFRYYKKLF